MLNFIIFIRKQHNNEKTHICTECGKGFFKASCLSVSFTFFFLVVLTEQVADLLATLGFTTRGGEEG